MVQEEWARLVVRVQPKASQNQVLHFKDEILHLRLAAPPIKGKANQELIRYLSDILGIRISSLIIEKGMTGRVKIVDINGLTQNQVRNKLESMAADGEET